MDVIGIVLIVAAAVVVASAFIYGLFRKSSRISWLGWQVFALFALTFLLDVVPLPEGDLSFWITAGVFLAALALDLLIGGLIRARMMKCEHPNKHLVRLSRFLGGLCAIVNVLLLAAVVVSVFLSVFYVTPFYPAFLADFYETILWVDILSPHLYDLFIITVCFLFVRAGLRVGFVRALYYLLMFALTFASVGGAILLCTKVSVFADWGAWLGEKMTFVPPAAGAVLGHGVFALLFFAVLFAVAMLLGWLLHKGLRRALDCRTFGMISAILLYIIFLVVFLAVMCGLYFAVYSLVGQNLSPLLTSFAECAEQLFTSSRLSAAFYNYNPFLLLLQ